MFENYNWDTAFENFTDSLKVMGLAMFGIFAVILILLGTITLMGFIQRKLTERKAKRELTTDNEQ